MDKKPQQKIDSIGTLQGSRLLPLLFLVLMSDLDLWVKNSSICAFADDTTDICVADSIEEVKKRLEEDATSVIKCMSSNNLVINCDKTVYIQHGKAEKEEMIQVGKDTIKNKNTGKMLGMTLSADEGWEDHLKNEMNKLRRTLEVLRQLYYKVPREGLQPIAEGIFNSHLRYGIILTVKPRLSQEEETSKTLRELHILHNEMQRIILGLKIKDRIRNEDIWKTTGRQLA